MTELATKQDTLELLITTTGLITLWGLTSYMSTLYREYHTTIEFFGKRFHPESVLYGLSIFSSNIVLFSGLYRISKHRK
jgi:hypothetical protein